MRAFFFHYGISKLVVHKNAQDRGKTLCHPMW
jgi:hypothetical protein